MPTQSITTSAPPWVDRELRKEIDVLIEACEKKDGLRADIFTDESLNVHKDMHCAFALKEKDELTGFLFIFAPMSEEIEVSALISPTCRRQGCFTALLKEAEEESARFRYKKGFLVCNAASETGMKAMAHCGYPLHHTEYEMRYVIKGPKEIPEGFQLETAYPDDAEALAALGAKIFAMEPEEEYAIMKNSIESLDRLQWKFKHDGKTIGLCAGRREGKKCYIYGLGVHPDERRKGYGRIILDIAANDARSHGLDYLCLDVDSENPPALRLYQSYGFVNESVTNYYAFEY
jgi:ribosomal protein S18 acetylase RimI-like enzyme